MQNNLIRLKLPPPFPQEKKLVLQDYTMKSRKSDHMCISSEKKNPHFSVLFSLYTGIYLPCI